ncbi:immunoglobulin domain-containing protein [Sanguibacteroides justesenii]|uniref:Immunoglobulin I-set domain-containing protein n=1 Tax=Sanguibacteroides justesenii TaxID=1547597 RepID=A0A0C3R5J9_9PORP|nr:immunoglobulin domain-containing protein [Sanguibacteroides justesenii]KIO44970.1 hypothetical protein BA92_08105 [Sanguibacteroides justesenii]
MKKKLLFVLVSLVILTGFKSREAGLTDNFNIKKVLSSEENGLPEITKVAPNEEGLVFGIEGQIITFYIEYTANPGATYKVYKGEQLLKSSEIAKNKNKVTVTIENVTRASEGSYIIEVVNTIGVVEQMFYVTVIVIAPELEV